MNKTESGKAVKLNSDIYSDDFKLLSQLQEEKALESRKDALHLIFNTYRGISDADNKTDTVCRYLFGEASMAVCVRNEEKTEKTTAFQCAACLKAKQLREEDALLEEIRRAGELYRRDELYKRQCDFWGRFGVPHWQANDQLTIIGKVQDFISKKDAEIEELKKPSAQRLTEIANLKKDLEKLAPFEAENTTLRLQIQKMKREPLAEKNAWLTAELGKKETEIETLKAENAKQEALINAYMFNGVKPK